MTEFLPVGEDRSIRHRLRRVAALDAALDGARWPAKRRQTRRFHTLGFKIQAQPANRGVLRIGGEGFVNRVAVFVFPTGTVDPLEIPPGLVR